MISFTHKGDFHNAEGFLSRSTSNEDYVTILRKYGNQGVQALASATPVDTGLTAASWDYVITVTNFSLKITWTNSHVDKGVPIAVILQYGHGTRQGGYVQGRDYINPAMAPVFDRIIEDIWAEVRK